MHKDKQLSAFETTNTNLGSVDSILSNLFKIIIKELDITPSRFYTLIERYTARLNAPTTIRELTSVKGNLKKELLKSTMSWKVFVKALSFINVRKFTIRVTLTHANGQTTFHEKTIELDTFDKDLLNSGEINE